MDKITDQDILGVIQDALELKEKCLTINSSMKDVEGWDSLGHLSILAALDKFFNGKIGGINELVDADSVQKIIKIFKDNSLM